MKANLSNFRRYYPWLHFIPGSVLVELATLGPLGRVKKAPGTVGSLAGIFLYCLLFHKLDPLSFLLLTGLFAYWLLVFVMQPNNIYKCEIPG